MLVVRGVLPRMWDPLGLWVQPAETSVLVADGASIVLLRRLCISALLMGCVMEGGSGRDDDHVISKMSKAAAHVLLQAGCVFLLCGELVASFTVWTRLLLKLKIDGWC